MWFHFREKNSPMTAYFYSLCEKYYRLGLGLDLGSMKTFPCFFLPSTESVFFYSGLFFFSLCEKIISTWVRVRADCGCLPDCGEIRVDCVWPPLLPG